MSSQIPNNSDEEINRLKSSLQKQLKNQLKKIERKLSALQSALESSQHWQNVAHEALLLQAHLYRWKKGLSYLIVEDWENNGAEKQISLNLKLTASQEIEQRMRLSKKMQRALPHLQREIEKSQLQRQVIFNQLEVITTDPTLQTLQQLSLSFSQASNSPKRQTSKAIKVRSPYREFWSHTGLRIWVGKGASDNDKLTFSLANGNDYWLHAVNCQGPHVVIKCDKNQIPDSECIEDALQLALAFSKRKNLEGEVLFTQRKFVSRFGKTAGKVHVSQHKTFYVRLANERLEAIKQRKDIILHP